MQYIYDADLNGLLRTPEERQRTMEAMVEPEAFVALKATAAGAVWRQINYIQGCRAKVLVYVDCPHSQCLQCDICMRRGSPVVYRCPDPLELLLWSLPRGQGEVAAKRR
eukprot:11219780-Lingulodinium_polyedra.AAC.1